MERIPRYDADEVHCPHSFYSDEHGYHLRPRYWPGYGFVAPEGVTTNGDPNLIREFFTEDDKKKFDAWVMETNPKIVIENGRLTYDRTRTMA